MKPTASFPLQIDLTEQSKRRDTIRILDIVSQNFRLFSTFPGDFSNFCVKSMENAKVFTDPMGGDSVGQCSYPTNVRYFLNVRRLDGVEPPEGHEKAPDIFAVNFPKMPHIFHNLCVYGFLDLPRCDGNIPKNAR